MNRFFSEHALLWLDWCFDVVDKQVQQTNTSKYIKITNHEYVDKLGKELDKRLAFFGNTKKKIQTIVNIKFMTQFSTKMKN